MDEHRTDRDRTDEIADERDENAEAAGDILGVSHVEPGGLPGERFRDEEEEEEGARERLDDEEVRRRRVGSRDVTEGTTGGTGPDTGGSGVHRRGSGATGTDIGR
jgi:hypothetical protein